MSEQQGAEVAELGAAVVGQRNLEEGPWDRPSPLLQGTQLCVCLLPALEDGAPEFSASAGGTYLKPANPLQACEMPTM